MYTWFSLLCVVFFSSFLAVFVMCVLCGRWCAVVMLIHSVWVIMSAETQNVCYSPPTWWQIKIDNGQ